MHRRCYTTNPSTRRRYYDRDITVCDRWHTFENFFEDMGHPPTDTHSIDRINNLGNYEPSNCRWATPKEQSRNTRRNRLIEWDGELVPAVTLAERYGIPYKTFFARITAYKWTVDRALNTPVRVLSK